MSQRPTIALFPGAMGNQTPEDAAWWLRHVITSFKNDYDVRVLTYDGRSLNQIVEYALEQLHDVPDGSFALCYSMGAQIARGVAAKRPRLFRRVALFSGLERTGVRSSVFLHNLSFMLLPMLRTLIGRPLKLDTLEQVKRVFMEPFHLPQTSRNERFLTQLRIERDKFAQSLLMERLFPEPAWPMLQLFLPGLRQRFPPFPCPVMAIVPRRDYLLPKATYCDEDVKLIHAIGAHSLILDQRRAMTYFVQIEEWFQHN